MVCRFSLFNSKGIPSHKAQLFMEGQLFGKKKLGDFGTKICYFIRKNTAENGPLVFRTVPYSKYDEKLGNHE